MINISFITPKPSYSQPRARGGYLLHPDDLQVRRADIFSKG